MTLSVELHQSECGKDLRQGRKAAATASADRRATQSHIKTVNKKPNPHRMDASRALAALRGSRLNQRSRPHETIMAIRNAPPMAMSAVCSTCWSNRTDDNSPRQTPSTRSTPSPANALSLRVKGFAAAVANPIGWIGTPKRQGKLSFQTATRETGILKPSALPPETPRQTPQWLGLLENSFPASTCDRKSYV